MASIVSVKSLSLPDSRSSNKQYIDSIRALSASVHPFKGRYAVHVEGISVTGAS